MLRFSRLVLLLSLALVPLARATTMIYPVEAIDDLWNLPADEFKAKYAGINITGLGPSDEGWYVRYKHENLTCLFGPLADREAARSKKWDMETVRDAAIRNRPSLASSQVDFVRFTFSGVYGKGGDGNGGNGNGGPMRARISADGKSGPDGDLDGDGIPNSKDDDMDGDGIPNDKDDDIDGDGIPNGKDDYGYGKDPGVDGYGNGTEGLAKDGSGNGDGENGDGSGKDGKGGKGGKGGKSGNGDGGDGDQLAGGDGSGDGKGGSKSGSKVGSKSGQGGQGGEGGDGGEGGGGGGQGGQSGKKGQVASSKRGGQSGSSGGQSGGQSGSQGGQSGQQSGGQQGGGSSGGQSGGQPGGGGSPGMPSGGGGGGGNPLQMLAGLLKKILGL